MNLFRLNSRTLLRRKSWVICVFVVGILPLAMPLLTPATENPALYKPALAQATWAFAWVSAGLWGFFSAAKAGESLRSSGLGEYFRAAGIHPTRQLLESWLALVVWTVPLGLLAALLAVLAASPAIDSERQAWIATNFQYFLLFAVVIAPLLALAIATASRFGAVSGFLAPACLAAYGLHGVGYLKMLGSIEEHPVLSWIARMSPHYHLADPTERLRYKMGAIDWAGFPLLLAYFLGIALVLFSVSRLVLKVRTTA